MKRVRIEGPVRDALVTKVKEALGKDFHHAVIVPGGATLVYRADGSTEKKLDGSPTQVRVGDEDVTLRDVEHLVYA